MCGIAGYSVNPGSRVPRTLAAQALLAGIAERGDDATGYAFRGPDVPLTVRKQLSGATAMLDAVAVEAGSTQLLVHVRDFTKGHPTIEANNHPIRHGAVVGVHNGVIANDEDLFAEHGFTRHEPEMTVDSEIIFALLQARPGSAAPLEELHGAMAAAWLDERDTDNLWLARGVDRPLWLGRGRHEVFFASTRDALEVVEETLRLGLRKREVTEGRLLRLTEGRVAATRRFLPDRTFREADVLPAVRAPGEREASLARLATIAAWA